MGSLGDGQWWREEGNERGQLEHCTTSGKDNVVWTGPSSSPERLVIYFEGKLKILVDWLDFGSEEGKRSDQEIHQ